MSIPSPQVCRTVDRRDSYQCARCGVSLFTVAGSHHHRKRRSQSSPETVHNVENLILLCGSGTTGCHGWVHSHPMEAYEQGFLVHSYQEPSKVPVRTYRGWRRLLQDGTCEACCPPEDCKERLCLI